MIGIGDLVVKRFGSCRKLPRGTVCRVVAVYTRVRPPLGFPAAPGLGLAGWPTDAGYAGWYAGNFVKLNDSNDDLELIERIKNCRPAKRGEPA